VDLTASALPVPVLHAVTNDEIVARSDFISRARSVMRAMGARGALQLRAPRMSVDRSAEFLELALTLVEEQERGGAWLVINDRVDVALMACARGVQLTSTSLEVPDAQQVLAKVATRLAREVDCAVGASVHSLEEAIGARVAGASWGVVSDVLTTHEGADSATGDCGPALLERLVRYSGIPIVAIGGIVPQHVAPLRRAGVHGIAAIRGIWDVDHSERAVIDYLSAYDSEVGR
jgi:thiamine-phosphate diphosphorylase